MWTFTRRHLAQDSRISTVFPSSVVFLFDAKKNNCRSLENASGRFAAGWATREQRQSKKTSDGKEWEMPRYFHATSVYSPWHHALLTPSSQPCTHFFNNHLGQLTLSFSFPSHSFLLFHSFSHSSPYQLVFLQFPLPVLSHFLPILSVVDFFSLLPYSSFSFCPNTGRYTFASWFCSTGNVSLTCLHLHKQRTHL